MQVAACRMHAFYTACVPAIVVCLSLLVPVPTGAAEAGREQHQLLVFSAISLRDVLRSMTTAFEERHPDVEVLIHAGASGLLARQIERGAPADLFLSAASFEIDRLENAGALQPGSRVTFASNRIVIAVARGIDPPAVFNNLAQPRFDRIAIGNPRTVPAGRYAEEALRRLGLWDQLEGRLVPAENARQVLTWVERGETAAGLVYLTDANLDPDAVTVGPEPPIESYRPILYQATVPADTRNPEAARALIEFLRSGEGRTILTRFGFPSAPAK